MPSLFSISPSLVYSSISHHEHTHLGSLFYFLFLPCSPCFSAYLAAFSLSDHCSTRYPPNQTPTTHKLPQEIKPSSPPTHISGINSSVLHTIHHSSHSTYF
ncbi:hypothetical protein CPAR01_03701 [Colletotrichum paranaense]|uniref:Uncharacterized protein n=2 Tax=Colletotrichum acutatum species complex TaxID=2707335 RepID=A0AAI9V2D9_9PEZI|nr:uncharacterized protein CPAR01_03701 [Colletotrichum paranaense]KAK1469307.1 hypothetical protein CMEL01_01074 [Colletotrichum melonis]KAK1543068.1 hypothetical protein CPAR01_03701 [Colletotrichum paranaense]